MMYGLRSQDRPLHYFSWGFHFWCYFCNLKSSKQPNSGGCYFLGSKFCTLMAPKSGFGGDLCAFGDGKQRPWHCKFKGCHQNHLPVQNGDLGGRSDLSNKIFQWNSRLVHVWIDEATTKSPLHVKKNISDDGPTSGETGNMLRNIFQGKTRKWEDEAFLAHAFSMGK